MRDFGEPVGPVVYEQIKVLVKEIFDRAEPKRSVRAADFAMEEHPDRVVVHEADIRFDGGRLRIATTEAAARPPFEWLWEITSNIGEADYFKHYLVLENGDVVLAQRKVLTPVDAQEAQVLMDDLAAAEAGLA